MAGNAIVNIKFAADLKSFSSGMQNANRSIQQMSKKLQRVGAALSIGVTAPLTAFGVASLKNWDAQVKAIAQVETGLKTTGNAVGFTSEQLQKMASELQNNSLFGDEDILQNATAQLLTFTNIAGEQFARTQQAALDLSTRLDGDLKSASIQLGKALNDPVANLSALSRSGIQFSEDQKATINALVETNQLAEAQNIILTELEAQYGNSAAAAAAAGTGPLKQLANAFGDIQEEVGAVIGSALLPFVESLKGIVASFQALSPQTKKFIVILGGVAAAIGPLLALAGTILPAIATGFTVLTGPIGLIVAGLTAVGVVIYKNWAPIKQTLVDIANYFIDLYNESTVFRIAVQSVVLQFKNLFEIGKFALNGIWTLLKGLADAFVNNFKLIGKVIKAVFTGNFSEIGGIVEEFKKNTVSTFAGTAANLGNDWQALTEGLKTNTKEAFDAINKRAKIIVKVETAGTTDVGVNPLDPKKNQTSGSASKPKATTVGDGLQMIGLNISTPLEAEAENLDTTLNSMQARFASFSEEASEIVSGGVGNILSGFGSLIGGLISGTAGISDFKNLLLGTLGGMLEQLGQIAINVGIGLIAIKKAFESLNPFVAIAAGIALLAFGGAIKSQISDVGKNNFAGSFAEGGVVGGNSYTGDKLFARINSGEMVLNQRQQSNLANMLAPASSNVSVVLQPSLDVSGDKLRVLLNRVDKRNNRLAYEG